MKLFFKNIEPANNSRSSSKKNNKANFNSNVLWWSRINICSSNNVYVYGKIYVFVFFLTFRTFNLQQHKLQKIRILCCFCFVLVFHEYFFHWLMEKKKCSFICFLLWYEMYTTYFHFIYLCLSIKRRIMYHTYKPINNFHVSVASKTFKRPSYLIILSIRPLTKKPPSNWHKSQIVCLFNSPVLLTSNWNWIP